MAHIITHVHINCRSQLLINRIIKVNNSLILRSRLKKEFNGASRTTNMFLLECRRANNNKSGARQQ